MDISKAPPRKAPWREGVCGDGILKCKHMLFSSDQAGGALWQWGAGSAVRVPRQAPSRPLSHRIGAEQVVFAL